MFITPHRHRLGWLTLLAFVCTVASPYGRPQAIDTNSPAYINFLEQNSMLFQADQETANAVSGMGVQWHSDFSTPKPTQLAQQAPVWLLYYPGSVITKLDGWSRNSGLGRDGATLLMGAFGPISARTSLAPATVK